MANTLSRALTSPAFFRAAACSPHLVDIRALHDHHSPMITNLCIAVSSKKAPLPGASDRRAR
jgi:hypothetical protein